jgi:hypothetical protein
VVEGARLESVCTPGYRGFESHPLRQYFPRVVNRTQFERDTPDFPDYPLAKERNR